jgi:carbon-monoxide dehydrogenase small subunit
VSERIWTRFAVNGVERELELEPRRTLADVLRVDLRLTGTHVACEQGVCGSCTVLLDGEPVRSCLLLGVQADGAEVTTVEGVGGESGLHPLQQAFRDRHSFQCGFCTPGFVVAGVAFLRENPRPTRAQIVEALASNLCRCTGYRSIVDGVELAAERLAAGEEGA